VLGRRQVLDEERVPRPGKVLRVLRAADQEFVLRQATRGLHEQLHE
jgi:hypothetical protein